MSSEALLVEPISIETGPVLTANNIGAGDDPAAYNGASTYALADQVTQGESIWQSAQAGNIGHDPTTDDGTWWTRVGAINSMRMFDRRVGAQSENPDTIEVGITPGSIIDVISVKNVEASFVRVVQTTPADGVVYDRTIILDAPVADWYEYFFGQFIMQTAAIFPDVKPYTEATYTITIDNTGGTAKCGELLMGAAFKPGITEIGVQTGIDDYSLIQADEFGVRDIVERDYTDNLELTVYVRSLLSATFVSLLTRNRARAFLLIAGDSRADAQTYGIAESWRRVLSYPGTDVFNIVMKGLT